MEIGVSGDFRPGETIVVGAPLKPEQRLAGILLCVVLLAGMVGWVLLAGEGPPTRERIGQALGFLPLVLIAGLWVYALDSRSRPGIKVMSTRVVAAVAVAMAALVALVVLMPWANPAARMRVFLNLVPLILIGGVWLLAMWRMGRPKPGANFHAAYRVEDEGFTIETPTETLRVRWDVVKSLDERGRYWVMRVQGGYVVPRRFFADPAQERAFVASVLERLSPWARTSSGAAERFAAGD